VGAGGTPQHGRVDVRRAASPRRGRERAAHSLRWSSRARQPGGRVRVVARGAAGAYRHRCPDTARGRAGVACRPAQAGTGHNRQPSPPMHRAFALSLLAVALAAPRALHCQARGASALGELVEGLPVETRVLVIGAHPDDEDTRLIAWLTKGHHMDVAYLSLTRGDGGQNLIGNELGEALGVIRTEELLAARRIDGAHQY